MLKNNDLEKRVDRLVEKTYSLHCHIGKKTRLTISGPVRTHIDLRDVVELILNHLNLEITKVPAGPKYKLVQKHGDPEKGCGCRSETGKGAWKTHRR